MRIVSTLSACLLAGQVWAADAADDIWDNFVALCPVLAQPPSIFDSKTLPDGIAVVDLSITKDGAIVRAVLKPDLPKAPAVRTLNIYYSVTRYPSYSKYECAFAYFHDGDALGLADIAPYEAEKLLGGPVTALGGWRRQYGDDPFNSKKAIGPKIDGYQAIFQMRDPNKDDSLTVLELPPIGRLTLSRFFAHKEN